ncbi:MAG: YbaB/EbfC family nucleoid-associated protein [Candidatus Brocadiia bacterium]
MPTDFNAILRQAQKMQKEVMALQEDLKKRVVDGASGGGMVTAYVNGGRELVKIKIDKQVVDPADVDMLEDLVLAAVASAMAKADEMVKEEMKKVTGGMNLPGMM